MTRAQVHFTIFWFFFFGRGGTERVRLRAISQPKPLGLGAEMPMEQDEAQCSGLGLSGAQDTVISGTGKSTKTLCSVYPSLAFSHILAMTPDTSGKHPRKSAKDLSSHTLRDQTASAFGFAPPPPSPLKSLSLSFAIISCTSHNFSLCRPLRLLIPI